MRSERNTPNDLIYPPYTAFFVYLENYLALFLCYLQLVRS